MTLRSLRCLVVCLTVPLAAAWVSAAYAQVPKSQRARELNDAAFAAIRAGSVDDLQRVLEAGRLSAEYRPGALELRAALQTGTRVVHGLGGTGPVREDSFGVATRLKLVQLLIDAGADPGAKDGSTAPVFVASLHQEDAPILEFFLDKGARTNAVDFGTHGRTWVRSVVLDVLNWKDEKVAARVLPKVLKGGASVNEDLGKGRTILMAQSRSGRIENVHWLLRNGAAVNARDSEGLTPLMEGARSARLGVVQALLDAGADVKTRDASGASALHYAAGSPEVTSALLATGLPPDVKDRLEDTALHWTARHPPPYSFKRSGEAKSGDMAVVQARRSAALNVRVLAKAGAAVNSRNANGMTPLHLVYMPEVAEALLDAGADVNAENAYGYTPLHSAALRQPELATLLIARGADLAALTAEGEGFLHIAAAGRAVTPALKDAVAKKADVNAKDRQGRTPLHHAFARWCSPDIVSFLLGLGANPYLEDANGDTPVLRWANIAASDYQGKCLSALLGANVNVEKRNSKGVAPVDVLKRTKYVDPFVRGRFGLPEEKIRVD